VHDKMKYRPDIDGLRAVAVLAVLFYHAGFDFFSGGYVGVDVFFVISGFLITKKIADEILENKFTLISFYEKRIRRIFPALFTVILLTIPVGAWLYDISTYRELGQSATATTLFLSNIFFWTQSGYFESPSALKPLLHMWSLSVEEQFYLGLPLLLVLLFRFFKKYVRLILTLIAGASFITVIITLGSDPSAAFFLTRGRIWELLFGSLLALSTLGKMESRGRNFLSISGIALILASVLLYSEETAFPGAAAIPPVLGSALIIAAGIQGSSLVGKILSTKPFVFIGKISYSLYLWHWPLLVFARVYLIREFNALNLIIWFGATFLLSYLSWKYIETPFRSLTFIKKPRIFYLAAGVMVVTGLAGFIIHQRVGLPGRIQPGQAEILDRKTWHGEMTKWLNCETVDEIDPCLIGAYEQPQVFLLWGDSHANAMAPAVHYSASETPLAGYLIWRTGCPPLLGIDRMDHPGQECSTFSRKVIHYIEDHPEIKTVIISSRWVISADGSRFKSEEGNTVKLVDAENPNGTASNNHDLFVIGLQRTVEELVNMGRDVILVSSVPEIGYHVPSAYFVALRTNRDITALIAPTVEEFQLRNEFVLSVLSEVAENNSRVWKVDPAEILCNQQICQIVHDNKPLYNDDDHLSTTGGQFIAEVFDPVFENLKNH